MTRAVWLASVSLALFAAESRDWPTYGGGPAGIRYSPLSQITRANVARLHVAWTFDTQDGPGDPQTQPIVVDGVLYGITPTHKAIALDAATGKLRWTFDPGIRGRGPDRSVVWWSSGAERRLFVAVQSFLYALDPATGQPIPGFGDHGRIDLRNDLGRDPTSQSFVLTSPGIVYRDLLIVGGRLPEALPAAPGDIRAYDVRTGKQRWSFHTIPHPGEFGYNTWPPDAWTYSGAANNWAGFALDENRGIVYAPTGSAASDFYGADRLGDNLFANCLLALNAATGERIWHFQGVRHDIWDRDFPSPPALVSIRRGGRAIDAVAQTSKQGFLYLFDRATGEPLFPLEHRPYPPSDVPGERAAAEQALPTWPPPFARQFLTEAMLTRRTPAAHAWAVEHLAKLRNAGEFLPFAVGAETVIFPGYDGGAEWGGPAFDPATGWLYVNANEMAWTGELVENKPETSARRLYLGQCATCHGEDLRGAPPQIPALAGIGERRTSAQIAAIIHDGGGRMPAFPNLASGDVAALIEYLRSGESKELAGKAAPQREARFRFNGYHKFLDPDGYPAVEPPWGTLTAIDLATGKFAWRIPLGEYPELADKTTGSENYGGPIVTAGGLVFIAATNYDRKFRAFDKATGKLLWETTLPMAGNATPITYEIAGRQFVVIYATGGKSGKWGPSGGVYVAFAL